MSDEELARRLDDIEERLRRVEARPGPHIPRSEPPLQVGGITLCARCFGPNYAGHHCTAVRHAK